MKKPVVSVVIPNYNYAHFLPECLDSVLRQTYRDWEIIVVDDNSTDASREIVEDYIRCHPDRQIRLKVNPLGPSGTPTPINIGIRHMRGEYFAWLSSDDVFESDKLETQVRFLEDHPEVGLVHTSYATIDGDSRKVGEFHPPNEFETDVFTALLDGNFINGNTVLIRREVLNDLGPFLETDPEFHELWRAAEYYYWLKIALRYPIVCIDRLLHRTRRHEGNAEFNNSSLGSTLERMYISRCFREHEIEITPEMLAAIGNRGLMSLFAVAFENLSFDEKTRTLRHLDDIETDRDRWDRGQHAGVRKLDIARIRTAFQAKNPLQAKSMLAALSGLEQPQIKPYQAAAANRLARLDTMSGIL